MCYKYVYPVILFHLRTTFFFISICHRVVRLGRCIQRIGLVTQSVDWPSQLGSQSCRTRSVADGNEKRSPDHGFFTEKSPISRLYGWARLQTSSLGPECGPRARVWSSDPARKWDIGPPGHKLAPYCAPMRPRAQYWGASCVARWPFSAENGWSLILFFIRARTPSFSAPAVFLIAPTTLAKQRVVLAIRCRSER